MTSLAMLVAGLETCVAARGLALGVRVRTHGPDAGGDVAGGGAGGDDGALLPERVTQAAAALAGEVGKRMPALIALGTLGDGSAMRYGPNLTPPGSTTPRG